MYAGGEKCMTKGMSGVAEFEKITEEEAIAIKNAGDPIDAPPGKRWYKEANVILRSQVLTRYSQRRKVK